MKKIAIVSLIIFLNGVVFSQEQPLQITSLNVDKLEIVTSLPLAYDPNSNFVATSTSGQYLAYITFSNQASTNEINYQIWELMPDTKLLYEWQENDTISEFFTLAGDYFYTMSNEVTKIHNLADGTIYTIEKAVDVFVSHPLIPLVAYSTFNSDELVIVDLRTMQSVQNSAYPNITAMIFSPDGKQLYVGDESGTLFIYQFNESDLSLRQSDFFNVSLSDPVISINTSQSGSHILVQVNTMTHIFNLTNPTLEVEFLVGIDLYVNLVFRVNGDLSFLFWNIENQQITRTITPAYSVDWSSVNGDLLIVGLGKEYSEIISMESGETVFEFPTDEFFVGSNFGGRFIVTTDRTELSVWGIKAPN